MSKFLLFYLWGPLQSWGGIAVGAVRPTETLPTKSGIVGLLAGALGIRRNGDDAVVLGALSRGIEFGVRLDARGKRCTDYHTTQVPKLLRYQQARNRREELIDAPHAGAKLNTILSTREYLQDAAYLVIVGRIESPPSVVVPERWRSLFEVDGRLSLTRLAEALTHPCFVPSLGRKSCCVGLPFMPQVVEVGTMNEALQQYPLTEVRRLLDEPLTERRRFLPPVDSLVDLHWEGERGGVTASKEGIRRDELDDRRRWAYQARIERSGTVKVSS